MRVRITKNIIEEYRKYLENDDLDGLYKKLGAEGEIPLVPAFTDFFLNELEINPLDYVTKVYPHMYCEVNVESITIPDSIKEIKCNAFDSCISLKSITIPNSITKIGIAAFNHCVSLETVSIPESITEIDDFAFTNCTSLKSITIPNSVTKIGDYAFSAAKVATVVGNTVTDIRTIELDLTFKCKENSYADSYAKKQNIKIEYI